MRLRCPRCGLSLAIRSPTIAPSYCPRCLVRRRAAVEFVVADARPVVSTLEGGAAEEAVARKPQAGSV
jgi:hypothetical protein